MKSPIRKTVRELEGYQPGEQPQEGGFTKLNTNENPYPPSPRIVEMLSRFSAADLRLYPDPLCRRLRLALAEYHKCAVERIFIANGSDELLRMCVQAFVERDGSVGFFDPSYSLYPVLAKTEGITTCPVSLPPDFSWSMPAGYTASLFFLANPNAPTSIQYPRKEVTDFCREFPGVVLMDEAYADFARDNFLDLALTMDNVLVARTLSKSFSLAGLRLGYVVGPVALMEAFYKIKDSYNVDRLAQEIAILAVQDAAYMRANVAKIKVSRERATGELTRRGFKVFPSSSNFLWVRPPKLPARTVFERLREKKVLVRFFNGRTTRDYLRITIGTDEQINILLTELDAILA